MSKRAYFLTNLMRKSIILKFQEWKLIIYSVNSAQTLYKTILATTKTVKGNLKV